MSWDFSTFECWYGMFSGYTEWPYSSNTWCRMPAIIWGPPVQTSEVVEFPPLRFAGISFALSSSLRMAPMMRGKKSLHSKFRHPEEHPLWEYHWPEAWMLVVISGVNMNQWLRWEVVGGRRKGQGWGKSGKFLSGKSSRWEVEWEREGRVISRGPKCTRSQICSMPLPSHLFSLDFPGIGLVQILGPVIQWVNGACPWVKEEKLLFLMGSSGLTFPLKDTAHTPHHI